MRNGKNILLGHPLFEVWFCGNIRRSMDLFEGFDFHTRLNRASRGLQRPTALQRRGGAAMTFAVRNSTVMGQHLGPSYIFALD